MDDAALFDRMRASLRAFYRVVAAGAGTSRVVERDGLTAAVVPSAPSRSIFNGVVYETPDALKITLDELANTYEQAGVDAWTVWVPSHDTETATLLERRGHEIDADPAAMAVELDRFVAHRSVGREIDADPDIAEVGHINDVAYGYEVDFVNALGDLPKDAAHLYVVRDKGKPVASTVSFDHQGDCCITFVATLPEARGQGLASSLMTHALLDARARGCATSSLQATKMGQPIYERMGYRDLGPLQMWERRKD